MRLSEINKGNPVEATCSGCECLLPVESFPLRSDRSGKRRPYCYTCANSVERARYKRLKRVSPFKIKTSRARARAKFLKVPFDISEDYLESIWTGECPVFKIEIFLNDCSRSDENAAELDRFIPSAGYVMGNVTFLSRRANRLKNNVTTTELQQIIDWMKNYG